MIKCFGKLRGIIILFSFFLFSEKWGNSLAWNRTSKTASLPLIRDIPFLNYYKKNEGEKKYIKRDKPHTEIYQYTNGMENKSRKDTKRNLFSFFLKNSTFSYLNKIKGRNKTFSSHHIIKHRNIFGKNQTNKKKFITIHIYCSDKNNDIKNDNHSNCDTTKTEISEIDTSQKSIIDKQNDILSNEDKQEEQNKKRQFLTDTKYYKRSKYSKAGKININNNMGNVIYDNNKLFSNIIQNDDNILTYVESFDDLENLKKKNNKVNNINTNNTNLPNVLIKNYYADSMRPNDLDFIKKNKYLENNINTNNNSQTNQIKNINKNNISFMNEFSVIGEIVGVHGLQGCLKVVSFTTFNDIRFKENSYRYIFMNSYPYPIPIKITYVKESLKIGFLYIKIEKIYSRTDALRLKGCLICDDKKKFPDIGENKYISTDLINFDIYIFNDPTNIPIGTVFSFVSKYDYICNKAVQDISEDLIKIELNKNVSINKIFNILKASQASENNQNLRKKHAPIKVLINRKNFNLYQTEEKITEENSGINESDKIKGDKHYYNSLENFEGYSYKKIYKCDFCDDIYDNLREATKHENSHFQHDEEMLFHSSDSNTNKESLYELTENELKNIKKEINYFFVPIIKEKTIRLVHYEHKKIYLDISTIFLLDNPK
ncbi:ribosome maturation factor RimM, putative [Plasmodium berghei]|uniref:Ribosome maturation factor RimM, putative n=2 Tax=Plasmodium berghei TaxID=5821 RepID=A0A509AGD9_PLABA|nr:ribosome maturation factor RimM, putative [Plasmodium berghei ANKA]CXI11064.1 ribosome maturation factor RimM, putative [Plasmodium berghei]SCL93131.1 ribosome maturation factor RimM, putative [Plasmodium berghei]SCM15795.1 ribosome maturation factor RimM, putative [Plasmodium berghei]SCM17590.1 ribosome maturation factor RimM, putative [Plasmodium berghei]SCN23071.1 ribosome maturation factor RimM, putative [Plasmodium berghei]|eukprot:XP_034420399.1 ribosome maturation factor RimM, putative [Plasmodium berghei ANKA]